MENNKNENEELIENSEVELSDSKQSEKHSSNIDDSDDDLLIVAEKKRSNFLVDLFTKIEDFSKATFKEKKDTRKKEKKEISEKKKELKNSNTTLTDIQDQRRNLIKNTVYKFFLLVFIVILISGAVVLSLQDNEKLERETINTKSLLNDTTSFGGIDQKDYFLEQNILDDKINLVEKNAETGRLVLNQNIKDQTKLIKEHLDSKFTEFGIEQKEERTALKEEIISVVDKKIENVNSVNSDNIKKISSLEKKVEKYKDNSFLKLQGGKLIFPESNKSEKDNAIKQVPNLNATLNNSSDAIAKTDESSETTYVYELVETDMSDTTVPELTFDTGMKGPETVVEDKIEFDLTTTLVRVTLINGIKAPTLDIGVKNPTPVLMSIEGVAYAANDNTRDVLKGCLLRGIAVGNINTSRAEIFGTHLSCILEKDSGKKYKIEHTFPNNEVWIKGEDGADGVPGLIVDSSGKILAKSAAIGFIQGLTNYFSAQNLVTGGTSIGTSQNTVSQLGTSMQSGIGEGMSSGFDLIVAKYEEILGGYYPFIDVKGGRKNLTAIFGGGVKLVGTPYVELNLEN